MNRFVVPAILASQLVLSFCTTGYAAEPKPVIAKTTTAKNGITKNGITWIKKQFVLPNPPSGFSVKFFYPYFSGQSTDVVNKLNQAMQSELVRQAKSAAKDYSEFVSDDLPISKEAKKQKDGSSITASFDVHRTTDNIVSVSFATCSYYYGAAHPVNNYFVFNTQLNPQALITLTNMTTDQKKFLQIASKQCAQKIKKILQYPNTEIIAEGTKPTVDNFHNFVFLDKEIGFYFNDAQASIHAEPIEKPVGVSYSLFRGLIRQESPVSALAK